MKAALTALAAGLLIAGQAAAHAHLVSSNPAANATVAAPAVLKAKFNEKLEAKFSGLELRTKAGAPVAVTVKTAGDTLDATPAAALKPGGYRVIWHVLSSDGHKAQGAYEFTVK